MNAMRSLPLLLAAAFCVAAAQAQEHDAKKHPEQMQKEKAGKAPSKDLDLRVKFDEETAKGEITCKNGKYENKEVVYEKCVQDKLDNYEEIAYLKKIVAKEKASKLTEKQKALAKKLAFLDSAARKLKKNIEEAKKKSATDMEIKKHVGALNKINKSFSKELDACYKEDQSVFQCPAMEK
jgi:hypothetical protein